MECKFQISMGVLRGQDLPSPKLHFSISNILGLHPVPKPCIYIFLNHRLDENNSISNRLRKWCGFAVDSEIEDTTQSDIRLYIERRVCKRENRMQRI